MLCVNLLLDGNSVVPVFMLTGKGAGLSSACGSTVHVAFQGSRHAEVVVRSAAADACAILGNCVRSTLEAAPAAAGIFISLLHVLQALQCEKQSRRTS